MSNVGRPRTGLKPCPHCGSKNRDSNGQCRCRNTAYRALSGAPKTTVEKARKVYDAALKDTKGNVEKALVAMREEFPSLAAKARKAPADKVEKATPKKAAVAKAEETVAKAVEPERYVLHIEDGFTDPFPYARKDAAIKNGVRSGEAWRVVYKGKVVAVSDDVL